MRLKHNNVLPAPLINCAFDVVLFGMTLLLAGCIALVPLPAEKAPDHDDFEYLDTYKGSTRQEVVEKLGPPEAVYRADERTYYVYDAKGDQAGFVGIPLLVPPYFLPVWITKGEDTALHCLALGFDEKGSLQDHRTQIEGEHIDGVLVLPAPPFFVGPFGGGKHTECAVALWNEEEIKQLEIVAHEDEIRSLETATPSDRLSVWAYSVFGNTAEGYDWLCRAADQGDTESRIQIGNLFYNEGHKSRNNLIQAYVWYSLANTVDNSMLEKRLIILGEVLSYEESQEARHRLESWKPNECIKALAEGGLLITRKSAENIEGVIGEHHKSPEDAKLIEPLATEILEITPQAGDVEYQIQMYWNTSPPESLKWLCRAALQGNPQALYRLGFLYEHGKETVKKDDVKAYQWYTLSADVGGDWGGGAAGSAAKRMARNLTSEQLAKGERFIAESPPGQCVIQTVIAPGNKRKN